MAAEGSESRRAFHLALHPLVLLPDQRVLAFQWLFNCIVQRRPFSVRRPHNRANGRGE